MATVRRWWPQQALASPLLPELARPSQFAAAVADLDESRLRLAVVCCGEPGPIFDTIAEFAGAGYTHVVLHQVGPDQARFVDLARTELLPAFS